MVDLDWSIPGGQMPVRQPCPACPAGAERKYGWTQSLTLHLLRFHPLLGPRERSAIIEGTLRRSRQEAIRHNGGY